MHRTSVPLLWRRFKHHYRLLGNHCKTCKTDYYPPREICPNCRRKGVLEEKEFEKKGTIHTYSIIHSGPTGFEKQTPYAVALIKLDNGPIVVSQIVDTPLDNIKIGAKVAGCFRKVYEDGKEGIIHYGLKFGLV